MRITRTDIIRLGEELAAEENAANDLWTWLPSYEVTKKHHRSDVLWARPSLADVLREAAMLLERLKKDPDLAATPDERYWFGRCACGNHCEKNEGGI